MSTSSTRNMPPKAAMSNSPHDYQDYFTPSPPVVNSISVKPSSSSGPINNDSQPRAKRIACVLCRRRKLKCDGAKPKCHTCNRLNHECAYDEVRKKSGPKRGYVKLLEARLQQVETKLKNSDDKLNSQPDSPKTYQQEEIIMTKLVEPSILNGKSTNFSWDMIGLGLEEPLPDARIINYLHEVYFTKAHNYVPMIHKPRYLAAMSLAPHVRPCPALRYIIWAHAASLSDKYSALAIEFYRRSRKYLEMDEMKSNGESIITLGHCQAWILISWYEFKLMYFPRAWLSSGRASGLATMLGLNRLDGAALDVKQCLPPPKDWTEREERRRTYWMAFCGDRCASIGTGWPHRLDERDIMTLLPSSEEAFLKSRPMTAPSLEQAFSNSAASNVSPIASVVLVTCLLGRNLTHLHRPTPNDNEENLHGAFWNRHESYRTLLDNIANAIPDHLRIPSGLPDTNVIFMNMVLHTSVICLHQAAIYKADRNKLPLDIINTSRVRCLAAAGEVTTIMKLVTHIDLTTLNPFIAFCLYVAARVYVQYLRHRPKEQHIIASLQFLGSAMHALSKRNPLTESFMAQIEIDLEGTDIKFNPQGTRTHETSHGLTDYRPSGSSVTGIVVVVDDFTAPNAPSEVPVNTDAVGCSPLFDLRESHHQNTDNSIFHPCTNPDDQFQSSSTAYAYNSHNPLPIDIPSTYPHLGASYSSSNMYHQLIPESSSLKDFMGNESNNSSLHSYNLRDISYRPSRSHTNSASHTPYSPAAMNEVENMIQTSSHDQGGGLSASRGFTAAQSNSSGGQLSSSGLSPTSSAQIPSSNGAITADMIIAEFSDATSHAFGSNSSMLEYGDMGSIVWDMRHMGDMGDMGGSDTYRTRNSNA